MVAAGIVGVGLCWDEGRGVRQIKNEEKAGNKAVGEKVQRRRMTDCWLMAIKALKAEMCLCYMPFVAASPACL